MLMEVFGPEDCAKCRLCCNFHRSSVWESPFIPEEQALRLQSEGITVERRQRGGWSFGYTFPNEEDAVDCPKLDKKTGCTFTSKEKPFECSIWPLRIMEKEGKLVIGRYRSCPALTKEKACQLDQLAKGRLLETLLAFVRKYPEAVRALSPEYDIIWEE